MDLKSNVRSDKKASPYYSSRELRSKDEREFELFSQLSHLSLLNN